MAIMCKNVPAIMGSQLVVTLRFSCLSVCPSAHSLGRPGYKLMAAAGTNSCFELAGLFASLKGSKTMPVLSDCRGTALIKQVQYQPQKHGNDKKSAAKLV